MWEYVSKFKTKMLFIHNANRNNRRVTIFLNNFCYLIPSSMPSFGALRYCSLILWILLILMLLRLESISIASFTFPDRLSNLSGSLITEPKFSIISKVFSGIFFPKLILNGFPLRHDVTTNPRRASTATAPTPMTRKPTISGSINDPCLDNDDECVSTLLKELSLLDNPSS